MPRQIRHRKNITKTGKTKGKPHMREQTKFRPVRYEQESDISLSEKILHLAGISPHEDLDVQIEDGLIILRSSDPLRGIPVKVLSILFSAGIDPDDLREYLKDDCDDFQALEEDDFWGEYEDMEDF